MFQRKLHGSSILTCQKTMIMPNQVEGLHLHWSRGSGILITKFTYFFWLGRGNLNWSERCGHRPNQHYPWRYTKTQLNKDLRLQSWCNDLNTTWPTLDPFSLGYFHQKTCLSTDVWGQSDSTVVENKPQKQKSCLVQVQPSSNMSCAFMCTVVNRTTNVHELTGHWKHGIVSQRHPSCIQYLILI